MPKDDLTTVVNLVRNMRSKQKEYFRTRDYNVLMESKAAEGLVDKYIKNFDEKEKCGQELFDEPALPF